MLMKREIITVYSSPYAEEIYHKLGYTAADAEQTQKGIDIFSAYRRPWRDYRIGMSRNEITTIYPTVE